MARVRNRRELQVEDDLSFQRKTWLVERVGWSVFVVLLIAAALGAFGSGVFGRTEGASPERAVRAEYARFARLQAPTELVLHVAGDQVRGNQLNVIFRGAFISDAELQSLLPVNSRGGASRDAAILTFDAAAGSGDLKFVFRFKFNRIGAAYGQIGLQDGPVLNINQWIYP